MTGRFAAFLTARLKSWLSAKGLELTSEACNRDMHAGGCESSGTLGHGWATK